MRKNEQCGICTNLFAHLLNNYQGKFLMFYNYIAAQSSGTIDLGSTINEEIRCFAA